MHSMQEAQTSKPATPGNGNAARNETYFRFQLRGWVTFDPSDTDVTKIANAVDSGTGVVTLCEVLQTARSLSEINDEEVRERFENIAAAQRILSNVERLPETLKQRLQSALSTPGSGTGLRK